MMTIATFKIFNTFKKHGTAVWLSALVFCSDVHAIGREQGANHNDLANNAYNKAINKVQHGISLIKPKQVISFKQTVLAHDNATSVSGNKVWLDSHGNEVLLTEATPDEFDTSMNWSFDILVSPDRFPPRANLLRETLHNWIFELPVNITVEDTGTDLDEEGIEEQAINAKIAKNLNAELRISKKDQQIISYTILSRQQFSPESMVTINEFMVRIEFAQAWDDGPWVTQQISRKIKGNYAYFFDIDEFNTTRFSDFELTSIEVQNRR